MTTEAITIPNTDPTYHPKDRDSALDGFLLRFINDRRDLPFLHFILQSNVVILPFALYLFLPGRFHWWLGVLYLLVNVPWFMDRFILILHNTSHRPLFKPAYGWMNKYLPWVLGPFYGETPETYYAHHLGMHHPENNLPDDLSSTMRFRRDSAWDFVRYHQRFFWLAIVELSIYMWRHRRKKLMRRLLVGELGFYAVVAGLMAVNWRAAFVVFVVPYLIARFVMMAGNWGQHAFIDPRDPASPFLNSLTVINCRYNRRCFNDGYHIGHHRKANRHWTELPVEFTADRAQYADAGAIVFDGIDFLMVWFYLMRKRYDVLARHFVQMDGGSRSTDEIIALLKSRTRPIVTPAAAAPTALAA